MTLDKSNNLKYKAFISYSHSSDQYLAESIQYALQVIAKPWYKSKSFEVFRDETDLSISPFLWTKIKEALEDSEFLILMCSENSASSKWVTKEVTYWLENKSVETLVFVLTSGEIYWDEIKGDFDWEKTTSISSNFKNHFDEEPLYADFRNLRESEELSLKNIDFVDTLKPIVASLHEISLKELFGDIKKQHQKTIVSVLLIAIILFVLLVILVITFIQSNKKSASIQANVLSYVSESHRLIDPVMSYRAAEAAHKIAPNNITMVQALYNVFYNSNRGFLKDRTFIFDNLIPYSINRVEFFDKDSKLLIETDSTVFWMDLVKQHINKLDYPTENKFATISPKDNHLILTVSSDSRMLNIWNIKDSTIILSLKHPNKVVKAQLSEDGKFLTMCENKKSILWSKDGKLLFKCNAVDFSTLTLDGSLLIILRENKIIIYQIANNKVELKCKLNPEKTNISQLAISPDKQKIVFVSNRTSINLLNLGDSSYLSFREEHKKAIYSLQFSKNNEFIISSSDDGNAMVWDNKGFLKQTLYHSNLIYYNGFPGADNSTNLLQFASFSKGGNNVATALLDGSVGLWYLGGNFSSQKKLNNKINSSFFSKDSKKILSATSMEYLYLTSGEDLKLKHKIYLNNKSEISFASFSKDDSLISVGSSNGKLFLLNHFGHLIWELEAHKKEIKTIDFSPKNNLILTSSFDGSVKIWNLKGEIIRIINHFNSINEHEVWSAFFSKDGNSIITAGGNKAKVWNLDGGIKKEYNHQSKIILAKFSENLVLTIGNSDSIIKVWELEGNKPPIKLKHEDGIINYAAFSPNEDIICSVTGLGRLQIWNIDNNKEGQRGKKLLDFKAHNDWITHVSFSNDGKYVLTSTYDGKIGKWPISPDEIIKIGNNEIPNLSDSIRLNFGLDKN